MTQRLKQRRAPRVAVPNKWLAIEDWLADLAEAGFSAGRIAPLAGAKLGERVTRSAVAAACWRLGITLHGNRRAPYGAGSGVQ